MRILRIIYDWPPPWQGLAAHPYEITTAQVANGNTVDIFCGRWPKAGPVENPKGTTVYPIMREIIPNSIFFTSSVILFFKYLMWRRDPANKVDIIHSHGHFAIWIYWYRAFLKRHFPWANELKTPLVAHFHNTAKGRWEKFEEEGKDIKPDTKAIGWPMAVRSDTWAVECASACVFVSEDNRDDAIKYYNADPKRCFVLETGVNASLFVPASTEEKEKSRKDLDLDPYDKVILNHGAMVERKNVHLIVEALAFLPPHYKLLLVGDGDPTYQEKLNEIIKSKNLKDRVIKIGYTPYPQVPIAYQVSDIFVLPSSYEGLPKVVMQGLACNIPCLVSGFKVSEEIKGLHYIKDMDPQNIAKDIKAIVESNESVDINKVIVKYSWQRRAKDLDVVYEFAKKNYI